MSFNDNRKKIVDMKNLFPQEKDKVPLKQINLQNYKEKLL